MGVNQAYAMHVMNTRSDSTNQHTQKATTFQGIKVDSNLAYAITNTSSNVAYATAGCIEVNANHDYDGTNTISHDPNANDTSDCIAVDANKAYGTRTIPTGPNVAYSTVDCVYVEDRIDIMNPFLSNPDEADGVHPPKEVIYEDVGLTAA